MRSRSLFQSFWLLALRPDVTQAYWRMACSVSQTARVDPILSHGTVSGHVHKFAGGNNVNPSSTHDSLLASTCSSCEVQEDKSAYWTPQLYYSHNNGTIEEVQNEGMTVYYVGRGGDSSNTATFPPGFQMISGNSLMRSYDSQNLTYQNTRPIADRQHYMFDTNCVNGMRAQINFQSCWDGQNLYLPNSEHVAYLSGIDYGVCPPTHPVPIPGLFFEVLYWTNLVDQSAGGQFVFANGDTTGYGFHGDFLNGWNMDVQTAAVQNCLYTDNGGVVSACPALAPSDDVNSPRDCLEQPSIWDEPVHGLFDGPLPGCNPFTSGPDMASQVICPLNGHDLSQGQTPGSDNTTASTTTVDPSGFITSTTTVDPPFPTSGFNNTGVPSFTFNGSQPTPLSGPFSQSAPGIFVTISTDSNTPAAPMSTPTSTLTASELAFTITGVTFTTVFTIPVASSPAPFSFNSTSTPNFTEAFTPTTTFTTFDLGSVTPSPSAPSPSITFLTGSAACSYFTNFSIEGCPLPTSTSSTSASTSTSTAAIPDVFTTFITVTQPVTAETTSTFITIVTTVPTTPSTPTFRLRGRTVGNVNVVVEAESEGKQREEEKEGQRKHGHEQQEQQHEDQEQGQPQPQPQPQPQQNHGSGMGCMLWGHC